jgi:adenylosuccinate lyase
MAANLLATKGLVYSQAVLLEIVDSGRTRDEAYQIVQRNAMKTWDDGGTLLEHLQADPDVGLEEDTLAACFTTERFLKNTGVVFEKLAEAEL